jgi:TolB-like protein
VRRVSMKGSWVVALWLAAGCGHATPGDVTPDRRTAAEIAAREAIANEESLGAMPLAGNSIGIPPFEVGTPDTALSALGYGLADLLITDLARSRALLVVDRIRLDAVLRETQLVESGRVDTETAPRIGRLIRARRLVLGRLGGTADRLTVEARIADVSTGEVRTAVSAGAPLESILEAEKELAFRLLDEMNVTLTPAERSAVEQLPTRNVAALLAYSRGVRYETEGRYEAAAREYRQALKYDPGFREAAANLEEVEDLATPAPSQQANAGGGQASGAEGLVGDRLNWPSMSPLGNQYFSTPWEGGGTDLPLPTTITIIIEVPE